MTEASVNKQAHIATQTDTLKVRLGELLEIATSLQMDADVNPYDKIGYGLVRTHIETALDELATVGLEENK